VFDFFTTPSFWLVVSFAFFIILIVRPIVGIIISSLDDQRELISSELKESRLAREEAEAILTNSKAQREKAKVQCDLIIKNALEESKRLVESSNENLKEFLAMEDKRTKENINRLEMDSMKRLEEKVFDISFALSRNILNKFCSDSQDFRSNLDKDILGKLKSFRL